MLQGDLDVLLNREEFVIFMQSPVPLGPGKFHVVVLVHFQLATQHAYGPCHRRLKFNSSNFFKFPINNNWGALERHPIHRGN